jgi:ribosomal protein L14E/L6E/L27E
MWETGTVLRSLAGRDQGYLLCAMGMDGDAALVCDGKERPLERPKRKNPKHLAPVATIPTLAQRDMAGNRALRKALNRWERKLAEQEDSNNQKG